MAKTRTYHHFCPVARSLEVIGEKWSLLIVRDLLRGPQRFTDLMRCLGGITPKWLTLRLRDLEAVGIVERDREPGRREVWYRLTAKGRELAPVVESLAVWGIDHAMRGRLPDEPINPENALGAVATYRNRRGYRLPGPVTWLFRFGPDLHLSLSYDGDRWRVGRGAVAADLTVETTPEDWAAFITADQSERRERASAFRFTGDAERIEEFLRSFAGRAAAIPPPPSATSPAPR